LNGPRVELAVIKYLDVLLHASLMNGNDQDANIFTMQQTSSVLNSNKKILLHAYCMPMYACHL